LELLKIAKTRFASYYLTFRRQLKVREALASMASSDSWRDLKDRATSVYERSDFQEVEDTIQIATKQGLILQMPCLKPFKRLGPTMSFKSSLIMMLIIRQQEQSLKIGTPIYFGRGV
jgi:hypothetical protein